MMQHFKTFTTDLTPLDAFARQGGQKAINFFLLREAEKKERWLHEELKSLGLQPRDIKHCRFIIRKDASEDKEHWELHIDWTRWMRFKRWLKKRSKR